MMEITNKTEWGLTKREASLFKKIAKTVLGGNFELSLVICGDSLVKHNVLAYPLSKSEGEIFLNPSRKGDYNLNYLFLHACVHLKDFGHGPKMESVESKFLRKLKLTKN